MVFLVSFFMIFLIVLFYNFCIFQFHSSYIGPFYSRVMAYNPIPFLDRFDVREDYAKKLQKESGNDCPWKFLPGNEMHAVMVQPRENMSFKAPRECVQKIFVLHSPVSVGIALMMCGGVVGASNDIYKSLVNDRGYELYNGRGHEMPSTVLTTMHKPLKRTADVLEELMILEQLLVARDV